GRYRKADLNSAIASEGPLVRSGCTRRRMVTENEAFEEFHEELKLDPDEVAFAREFPDEIPVALSGAGVKVTNSFLQGSLARGTMVSPLKDVDMVVSLDRDDYGYLLDDPLGPD